MLEQFAAQQAFDRLQDQTGLRFLVQQANQTMGTGLWPDLIVKLEHTKLEFVAQISLRQEHSSIESNIRSLKRVSSDAQGLFIAEHISADAAARLRAEKINYIDASGNAHIDAPPYFVLIEGKIANDLTTKPKPSRVFSSTELKVIYALLANPEMLNANYGEIAVSAKVALGVVGTIIRDLKDLGYIEESASRRKRSWLARQKLISQWAMQYPALREQQYVGAYHAADANWWQSPKLKQGKAQLGGGFAAISYCEKARVGHASLYIESEEQWGFLRDLELVRVVGNDQRLSANVQVFKKFWQDNNAIKDSVQSVTHPLLTYADLLLTECARNHAAANEIAERYFRDA